MNNASFEKLYRDGLLSAESLQRIEEKEKSRLFSLHWEIKTVLYLGVLLLSTGLGILVYKNIDTIGHQVILLAIALISAGGFFYCSKTKLPFSRYKVASPNAFFDYVLLMACLSFVTFIGYLQFQYNVFGDRFGLVTFIPMVVLFFTAYFFDHIGILSLAITNLAAWVGIAITPAEILKANDFNSGNVIVTAVALGAVMVVAGVASRKRDLKSHFAFTYINFGCHVLFIALLAGMFEFIAISFLWFIAIIGAAFYFFAEAKQSKSFYFLLILTLYSYIALSYMVIRFLLLASMEMGGVYLGFMYFIGSAIGIILFLIRMNRKIKQA